jgi:hypothetical protein
MPTYSEHARQRMAERGVTEADVEAVMALPIGSPSPGNRPGCVVITGFDTNALPLRVVVDEFDTGHVVTVLP